MSTTGDKILDTALSKVCPNLNAPQKRKKNLISFVNVNVYTVFEENEVLFNVLC